MKSLFFSIAFLFLYTSVSAIDTLVLKPAIFKAAPSYSILTDKKYTYQQAVVNLSDKSVVEKKVRGKLQRSLYDYWTGIYLQNNSTDTLSIVAEAYIKEAWLEGASVIVCGENTPCSSPAFPLQDYYADAALIAVPPGTHLFVAKISDYNLPAYFAPLLSDAKSVESKFYVSEIYKIFLLGLLLGAFLIVAITAFTLFFIIKDKSILWYALYCIAIIVSTYLALQSVYKAFYWSFEYVPWIYTKMLVRVILLITYAKFVQHFIRTKTNMPQLNRLINIYIYVCIASLLPDIILLALGLFKESYVYYLVCRMALTISAGIIIAGLWKHRSNKYVQFILAGSAFIVLGEVVSNFVPVKYSPRVAGLGAFIEIIIFTFGIAYRVYTYYAQEKKLTRELLQKEKEVTALFRENTNLNMSLFQSQMNPHFVFNALNSIKEMILTDKRDEASRYLSKFGNLVRLNLTHNIKPFITLVDNNKQLEAYLEMESLRFANFSWTITVDDDVEADNLLIPPMLIQPIVENAIWHGLLAINSERKLVIAFSTTGQQLLCKVDDNGIGINASAENKKNATHKSVGLGNIRNRLNLLKKEYGGTFSLTITDKAEMARSKTTGTVATLSVPINQL